MRSGWPLRLGPRIRAPGSYRFDDDGWSVGQERAEVIGVAGENHGALVADGGRGNDCIDGGAGAGAIAERGTSSGEVLVDVDDGHGLEEPVRGRIVRAAGERLGEHDGGHDQIDPASGYLLGEGTEAVATTGIGERPQRAGVEDHHAGHAYRTGRAGVAGRFFVFAAAGGWIVAGSRCAVMPAAQSRATTSSCSVG